MQHMVTLEEMSDFQFSANRMAVLSLSKYMEAGQRFDMNMSGRKYMAFPE